MLRVAIIGAGSHSRMHHGPSLRDLAGKGSVDIELAAVCDLDREKAARYAAQFGFATSCVSIDKMFESEKLDAIIAVTPLEATRPIVGELLKRKIPLLLEKPPGRTAIEARELLEIADNSGTPTMVSFNRRFVPAIRKASQWLAAGDRKPNLIIARMLRHARLEKDFIVGTGIHLVDTVLSFFSKPARITSHRTTDADGARCEAILEFSDGGRGIVAIEPAAGIVEESYELIGPDYRLFADTHHDSLTIHEEDKLVYSWSAPDYTASHVLSGCYYETEAFLRAVAGLEPYTPTLAEAVATIETAEALHRV